jgi:hypothetical protein
MSFWDELERALRVIVDKVTIPPADITGLLRALIDLEHLLPTDLRPAPFQRKESVMTNPTGFVQILQSDLDGFATALETVKSALATYIATLLANQATPLAAADEAGLTKALADLTALEPPAPTPPAPAGP